MSATLPWGPLTAAPATGLQLGATRSTPPRPLVWWSLVGGLDQAGPTLAPATGRPVRGAKTAAARPAAEPTRPPTPRRSTPPQAGRPVTALGQLAQATADAQRATADAHALWLRQQEESLALIAAMAAQLTALGGLPDTMD